jgi:hypothetical protein
LSHALLQVGVLILVALPLGLVSHNLSQIGTGEFFSAQPLVGAIAFLGRRLTGLQQPIRTVL